MSLYRRPPAIPDKARSGRATSVVPRNRDPGAGSNTMILRAAEGNGCVHAVTSAWCPERQRAARSPRPRRVPRGLTAGGRVRARRDRDLPPPRGGANPHRAVAGGRAGRLRERDAGVEVDVLDGVEQLDALVRRPLERLPAAD